MPSVGDLEKRAESIENEVKENKKYVSRGTVENVLKEDWNALEEKRKEAYIKSINEEMAKDGNEYQIDSFDKLSVKQQVEYKNFELSKEEKEKAFKETFGKVKKIADERNDFLNGKPKYDKDTHQLLKDENGDTVRDKGMIDEYDELNNDIDAKLEEVTSEIEKIEKEIKEKEDRIAEIDGELNSPDITDERRKELEEEKSKIEGEKSELTGKKDELKKDEERLNELKDKVGNRAKKMISTNDYTKLNAVEAMGLMYGEDLVYNYDGIEDIAPTTDKVKQQYEDLKKAAMEKNDINKSEQQEVKENPNEQVKEENIPNVQQQRAVQQGAPGMGGIPMGAGFVAQQAPQAQQVEEQVQDGTTQQDPAEIAAEGLKWIGYDENKPLTKSSARAILRNFVDNPDRQMEILMDENASNVIEEAMELAGKTRNPIANLRFNKTRSAINEMAEKGLPEDAVKEFEALNGKQLYKTAKGNEYNELVDRYSKELAELEEAQKTDGSTPELAQRFNELEKRYAPIVGVIKFKDAATKNMVKKNIKFADRVKGLFSKKDKMLNEAPKEKKRNEKQEQMHQRMVNLQIEKYKDLSRDELADLNTKDLNPLQQEALEKILAQKNKQGWNIDEQEKSEELEVEENEANELNKKEEEKLNTKDEKSQLEETNNKKENIYTETKQNIQKEGFIGAIKKGINGNEKGDFGAELSSQVEDKEVVAKKDAAKEETPIETAYKKRMERMTSDQLAQDAQNTKDPELRKKMMKESLKKQREEEGYKR